MDYYYNADKKVPKKEKEINTKLVVYFGELPPDVDRSELDYFLTEQGFQTDSLYVKTGKGNKNFAYVKFKTAGEAARAVRTLHLKSYKDCIIKAEPFKKSSQTDKNKNDSNLFIKNLPPDTTNNQFYELFKPFGNIISIKLRKDEEGKCIGYG
ncbi:MAG: hypothetical protein MJ252_12790 [archaeon]|nr:hypothetical protein [archaeon]